MSKVMRYKIKSHLLLTIERLGLELFDTHDKGRF